jgi:hypothetical protein
MFDRVAAVVVAALLMVSCSKASPTSPTPVAPVPPPPAIHIAGQVLDYITGKTVSGTSIAWRPLNLDVPSSEVTVTSDAAGRFEVALPVADRYQFSIPLDTLNFQSGLVQTSGKRMETQILVNGGPCAARYGYVIDAVTRQPIAGAQVSRVNTAVTNAQGYYRLEIACEPRQWGIGTTTISASHPAYQFHWDVDGRSENTSYSGIRRHDFALQPLP